MGLSRFSKSLAKVVLPEPDSPTTPSRSPISIFRFRSATACRTGRAPDIAVRGNLKSRHNDLTSKVNRS